MTAVSTAMTSSFLRITKAVGLDPLVADFVDRGNVCLCQRCHALFVAGAVQTHPCCSWRLARAVGSIAFGLAAVLAVVGVDLGFVFIFRHD